MQPTGPHRASEHHHPYPQGGACERASLELLHRHQPSQITPAAKPPLILILGHSPTTTTKIPTTTNHNPHRHSLTGSSGKNRNDQPVFSRSLSSTSLCPYQPDKSRSYRVAMITPVRARQMPLSSTPLSSTPLSSTPLSSRLFQGVE